MATAKPKFLFLIALFTLIWMDRALSQEAPVGTLTIPDVTQQPVQIFSAGVGYSIPASDSGGGGPRGKAIFGEFTLTKLVDATSPTLLVSAASGRIFPAARIELYDSSGTTVLTIYELSNPLVTGASVASGQVGTTRALVEQVSLDYQQIRQTVMTPAGPVTACWDRSQNVAC